MMSDPRGILAVVLVGQALASGALAQGTANPLVVLDNDYVRETKDAGPCATAVAGRFEDRVLVAMGAIELKAGDTPRAMKRGDVAIF